jgi:hypothetical protein
MRTARTVCPPGVGRSTMRSGGPPKRGRLGDAGIGAADRVVKNLHDSFKSIHDRNLLNRLPAKAAVATIYREPPSEWVQLGGHAEYAEIDCAKLPAIHTFRGRTSPTVRAGFPSARRRYV